MRQRAKQSRAREEEGPAPPALATSLLHFAKRRSRRSTTRTSAALRRFISDKGKIKPRRTSGSCRRHQRQVALPSSGPRDGLLPYVTMGSGLDKSATEATMRSGDRKSARRRRPIADRRAPAASRPRARRGRRSAAATPRPTAQAPRPGAAPYSHSGMAVAALAQVSKQSPRRVKASPHVAQRNVIGVPRCASAQSS